MARTQRQISAEARRKAARREREKRARQRQREAERAVRKTREHNAKVDKIASRGHDQIERERQRGHEEIDRFGKRLAQDPISALGLDFDPVQGCIVQDTVEVRGRTIDIARGSINRLCNQPAKGNGSWQVRLVDALVASFGVVIAVEITNEDPDWSPTLSWVKKSRPNESACFLVDKTHGQYSYPVATTLGGKVVRGVPRTEIIVFEPPRSPTDTLEFRLEEVKLTRRGPRISADLSLDIPRLHDHLKQNLMGPDPVAELHRLLDKQADEAQEGLRRRADKGRIKKKKKGGCGCGCLLLVGAFIAGLSASRTIMAGSETAESSVPEPAHQVLDE